MWLVVLCARAAVHDTELVVFRCSKAMEMAEKLKEAASSKFNLPFSATFGCQYGQILVPIKCQSRFDAESPRSGKVINTWA